ncbi:MAG: hypothetical protein ACFFDX_15050 [Candidatus Odinarchaeota archaeon]
MEINTYRILKIIGISLIIIGIGVALWAIILDFLSLIITFYIGVFIFFIGIGLTASSSRIKKKEAREQLPISNYQLPPSKYKKYKKIGISLIVVGILSYFLLPNINWGFYFVVLSFVICSFILIGIGMYFLGMASKQKKPEVDLMEEKSKRIGISLEVTGTIFFALGFILFAIIPRLFPIPGLGGLIYYSFFLISYAGGILIIVGLFHLGKARKQQVLKKIKEKEEDN